MSNSGALLEALAERDAATQQVAALQQQLRRQLADSQAAMQPELEAMQQGLEDTGALRETLAGRECQLAQANQQLEATNEAKDELERHVRKAQKEAARCQSALEAATADLRLEQSARAELSAAGLRRQRQMEPLLAAVAAVDAAEVVRARHLSAERAAVAASAAAMFAEHQEALAQLKVEFGVDREALRQRAVAAEMGAARETQAARTIRDAAHLLEAQFQAKEEQIRQYRDQADAYDDRVVGAEARRNKAVQVAEAARRSQCAAEERLTSAQTALAVELAATEELAERCRISEDSLTTVRKALTAKGAALEDALKMKAAAERRCGQLDSQHTQHAATLRDTQDAFEVLQEESAALGAEHAETTARADRLESSCQETAAEVGRLEASARTAESVIGRQAAEGEALMAELNGVGEQLLNRDSELKEVNEQLTLSLQEAEAQITALSQLTIERDRLQTDLEACQRVSQQLRVASDELERQLSASRSQGAGLLAAAAQSEQHQTAYVDQSTAILTALSSTARQQEVRLRAQQDTIGALHAEGEVVRQRLAERDLDLHELRRAHTVTQENMKQLEGSDRFHQNFAAEALRGFNRMQAQTARSVDAEGMGSGVWELPAQRSRERAVQTAYCDLWQRNNTLTSAQQEVADLLGRDANEGRDDARGACTCTAAQGATQRLQSEGGPMFLSQSSSVSKSTDIEQLEFHCERRHTPTRSGPGGGGGSGDDAVPMRPTQLLHLVRAALSAKALADVARARSGDDAGVSMSYFLPQFFAYRFGSSSAVRQAANFRAGLNTYAGTCVELQRFICIIAGSGTSELACTTNVALPSTCSPEDTCVSDASICLTQNEGSQQLSTDTGPLQIDSTSEASTSLLPPLTPVVDTAGLLHETAGQLMRDLLATPGADALLRAVARPAFMSHALVSVDLGLRISECQAPQLWTLFSSVCNALGLPAAGEAAVRLHVRNCAQPAFHLLTIPSAMTARKLSQRNVQGLDPGTAAVHTPVDEGPRKGTALGQCCAADGGATHNVVLSSALVELLRPAELRAAMISALAPAILPAIDTLTPNGAPSCWAAVMTAASLADLSPAAALAAVPTESQHMCATWLLPMLQRVRRHTALCTDRVVVAVIKDPVLVARTLMLVSAGSLKLADSLDVEATTQEARQVDLAMAARLPALLAHESVETMLRVLGGNMPLLRIREMIRLWQSLNL